MVYWAEAGIAVGMAFYFIFPAYTANSFALIVGGGRPMDFGRTLKDGKRILGDGKTWRGLFGGTLLAVCVGAVMNYVPLQLPAGWTHPWSRADWAYSVNWGVALLVIFALCFGAMLGDSLGSLIKRRRGIGQGGKALLLDQLTFLAIAWLLCLAVAPEWFLDHFVHGHRWLGLVALIVLTPLIHRLINWVGYKIGAKKVPW
jgi:CDP-2,3-bis-(O-geranylgeranyl)-sn-glycerol synthase